MSSLNIVVLIRHLKISKGTKFQDHQLLLLCSSIFNAQLVALFSNASTTFTTFIESMIYLSHITLKEAFFSVYQVGFS